MTILIVYDSIYKNTEEIAKAMAGALAESDNVKLVRVNEANSQELKSAEILVVGSPTHGGRPSRLTQTFLNGIAPGELENIRAAAFDTSIPASGQKAFMRLIIKFFGYANRRIVQALEAKGADIIGAETFFVLGKKGPLRKGEQERAVSWIKEVLNNK